jgi:LysR family transcriptional regulator, glycine cleavage system transcriptional activator
MRKLPPLNWLRAFETAGRHLNFTRAAEELGVTQAAVSQHVKALEGFLGMPLFMRAHQRLVLTEAGKSFLPKLTAAFDLMSAGTSEVFSFGIDGGLTVRVPSSFSTKWLIPRLEKFHASHPGIDIRLTSLGQEANFANDHVDLEIRNGLGTWESLESKLLVGEDIFPVCSPDLFGDKKTKRHHKDLSRTTLLDVPGYVEGWDAWLNAVGAEAFENFTSVSFDQSMMAIQAAVSGMGVALGRSSLIEDELRSGRLIAPFDAVLKSSSAYYIVCPPEFSSRPRIRAFRAWLLEEAKQ